MPPAEPAQTQAMPPRVELKSGSASSKSSNKGIVLRTISERAGPVIPDRHTSVGQGSSNAVSLNYQRVQQNGKVSDKLNYQDHSWCDMIIENQRRSNKLQATRLRERYEEKFERLRQDYNTDLNILERNCSHLDADRERFKKGMEDRKFLSQNSSHFRNLVAAHDELIGKLDAKQDTIKQLQQDLATIRHGYGPIHDERYYRDQLSGLHRKIENWVNKLTRGQLAWTEDQLFAFLTLLSATGMEGAASAKELRERPSLISLTSFRAQRLLLRHAVAVCLFDTVFDLFAVGMEKDMSNSLRKFEFKIFQDACASGSHLLSRLTS